VVTVINLYLLYQNVFYISYLLKTIKDNFQIGA